VGSSIGKFFTVTCFGESHGRCVGVVIDGCPPGLDVSEEDIQKEVDKRKPGQSWFSTPRLEEDKVEILSGIFKNKTTGAPICILVWNKVAESEAYEEFRWKPRPGHADYPALVRYGEFNDYRGGGRFSGRMTVAFSIAGAIAKKLLNKIGVEVLAHTIEIGGVKIKSQPSIEQIRKKTYTNSVRCAESDTANLMEQAILNAKNVGDSVGGIVECVALNMPVGVGDPIFDSLDADIAKILFDIPAVKGVEFGAGFNAARMYGSENNDLYTLKNGKIVTETNNAGGILGGLSDGMPIVVRVAFKPTPSISKKQKTVDLREKKEIFIEIKGKHDVCIVPRAVPIVESAVAIILADHLLRLGLIKV
jgi:chorismate synthase